jgi:hypothetical protein
VGAKSLGRFYEKQIGSERERGDVRFFVGNGGYNSVAFSGDLAPVLAELNPLICCVS